MIHVRLHKCIASGSIYLVCEVRVTIPGSLTGITSHHHVGVQRHRQAHVCAAEGHKRVRQAAPSRLYRKWLDAARLQSVVLRGIQNAQGHTLAQGIHPQQRKFLHARRRPNGLPYQQANSPDAIR